jgi:hypothetical protein
MLKFTLRNSKKNHFSLKLEENGTVEYTYENIKDYAITNDGKLFLILDIVRNKEHINYPCKIRNHIFIGEGKFVDETQQA